jgi:uncharacterized membrane protein YfcA
MEVWQIILLAVLGVGAGWLNVMAGGGSLLTVPVMVFMGIPGPVANGTNRIGILLQYLSAMTAFRRKGYSDFKLSLSLAAVACVGASAGAMIGTRLEGEWFNRVLALVMIGVIIIMATDKKRPPGENGDQGKPRNLALGHTLMLAAGLWGGFIQIGVGFVPMPILHRVMGLDLVRVNMHKVFIVLAYTLVALTVFASQVEILWSAGLALALGTMTGGWLGAHMTTSHGEVWIRRVLYPALTAMIIKLLIF